MALDDARQEPMPRQVQGGHVFARLLSVHGHPADGKLVPVPLANSDPPEPPRSVMVRMSGANPVAVACGSGDMFERIDGPGPDGVWEYRDVQVQLR